MKIKYRFDVITVRNLNSIKEKVLLKGKLYIDDDDVLFIICDHNKVKLPENCPI